MDWLENHRVVLNCFEKTFTCLNEEGNIILVKGIPRKTSVRQMKRAARKGCKVFTVYVMNDENLSKEHKLKFDDIPVLRKFSDVFPEEIPGLPPKQELDFTIELVPGAVPISKSPYRMNILELNELKSQLKELIDKNYIRPSVSP